METRKKKDIIRPLLAVLAAVLAVGMAGSCALGYLALQRLESQQEETRRLADALEQLLDDGDGRITREDGDTVAGLYVIQSTLPISEAYRTGDVSALDERQQETLEMAGRVLDGIITGLMDDYEKEVAVYDWMCANLRAAGGTSGASAPDTPDTVSTPFGVLKYRRAVDVGLAVTFRMFMQMLDIQCMVVHNDLAAWNLVRLDGQWYHTDLAADLGEGDYDNFNMTDSQCARDRLWDTTFYPPASGLTYCYAYRNAVEVDDARQLAVCLRRAADAGQSADLFFLLARGDSALPLAVDAALEELDGAVADFAARRGLDMELSHHTVLAGDREVLVVEFTCSSGLPGAVLTEEERRLVQQSVREVFSDDWTEESEEGEGEGAGEGGEPGIPAD